MASVLQTALASYAFPYALYDFSAGKPITCSDMAAVEDYIRERLRSHDETETKHGLANIIYWGEAQAGYRDYRVSLFLDNVTSGQLRIFIDLVQAGAISCSAIKNIGMPRYSGMSFVSKVMMFHDPETYSVLDNQILKMRDGISGGSLNRLKRSNSESGIRISKTNEREYLAWCEECRTIAKDQDLGSHRAVDAERAFFALIQAGKHKLAKSLYDQFCSGNEIAEDLFSKNFSPPDSTSIISENIWNDIDV